MLQGGLARALRHGAVAVRRCLPPNASDSFEAPFPLDSQLGRHTLLLTKG